MLETRRKNLERTLYVTCFSQVSALSALVMTNFIEASRTLILSSRSICAPGHICLTPGQLAFACHRVQGTSSPRVLLTDFVRRKGSTHLLTSGLREALMGHVLRAGMFFPLFELFKKALEPQFERELYSSLVCSALTRTVTSVASFPLEMLRVVSQSSTLARPSALQSLRSLRANRTQSLSAFAFFWQKEMVFSAIFWSAYELIRENLPHSDSLQGRMAAAALAGGLSGAGSFPFDVAAAYRILNPKSPLSWWIGPALSQLLQTCGADALGFSFGLRVLRGMSMNAVYIGLYYTLKTHSPAEP